MYAEFYGLKELPFALTPDPRYIYFTPSHTEVMANLHYGIESGKGLIVVTGEVGTGKTTILRWMMQRLDRTVLVAYIFNPRLSVPEFYQHVATLLDVQEWETKSDLLIALGKILESRHSRGLRTVLIVDESQGLSPFVLEEIRLLSNFESDTAKHLQIVLTGQPELRTVLNYPDLRQLKQRVALRCTIKPLPNVEETDHYITSRLLVAGAERTDIFSPGAIDYIFRCSEGIPRNINNLCDNALLAGFAAGQPTISRAIIEEVAETFDMLPAVDRGMLTGEERETPARIFSASGRAELWAAGTGEKTANADMTPRDVSQETIAPPAYSSPTVDPSPVNLNQPPTTLDEVGAAFSRSGLVRENNG
ncbi:MAG: ral secretion pathway protein [Blastocatellia bacterium]|jgi:general secretion pathway protein A|nr:ral secretion pathway protein [Blastocatellia bacterium]